MKFTLIVIVGLALANPALAQPAAGARPIRDSAERQALRLAQTATAAAAQSAPVQQRSWVTRHPVLTGMFIGFGSGFAVGAATCSYLTAEGSCGYYTFPTNARLLGGLTIGGFGAGIGSAVGAIVSAKHR